MVNHKTGGWTTNPVLTGIPLHPDGTEGPRIRINDFEYAPEGMIVVVDRARLWAKIEEYREAVDEWAVAGERSVSDVRRCQGEVARIANELRAMLGLDPLP